MRRHQMGLQRVQRLPLFDNRHSILIAVLISDVGGRINRRTVLDTAILLPNLGHNFVELGQEVVSVTGSASNRGNNRNHDPYFCCVDQVRSVNAADYLFVVKVATE